MIIFLRFYKTLMTQIGQINTDKKIILNHINQRHPRLNAYGGQVRAIPCH